jgi:DNA polymerase III alpha subunit
MQEFGKILYKRQAAKEIREEKIRDAKRKIHEIECEIKETEQLFNDVTYIPLERLNKERAVLGAYVSGHPMASISTPYKTCSLSDDSTRVDGVAVDVEIKRRKSDQRPMAFFYIEDQGGKIRASLFTKAFEKCGDKLLEGQIYKFYGKVQIKKDIKIEIDENGEEKIIENIVKEFFVENIELYPVIEKEIFLIGNSSWNREEFVAQNCLLKKNHSAETGRKGVVFMNGVILDVPFAIDENILTNNKTDYQVCEEIPY